MHRQRGFNSEIQTFFKNVYLKNLLPRETRILEIGCGNGDAGFFLKTQLGVDVYALDITSKYLNNHSKNDLCFVCGDILNIPFCDNSFDFIFSYLAFRYLKDKLHGLKEVHRILKKGGMALIDLGGEIKESFSDNGKESFKARDEKGIVPSINIILETYRNDGQLLCDNISVPIAGNGDNYPLH